MAAETVLRLDMATGAGVAVFGKAGWSRCKSMSRSSSESRSRWLIREKPSSSRGANRSLGLFCLDGRGELVVAGVGVTSVRLSTTNLFPSSGKRRLFDSGDDLKEGGFGRARKGARKMRNLHV